MALVSALAVTAVFLVNLSYPEWTGGWSTGPRLLVPLLPFAMLPVAGLLAAGGRGATLAVLVLALGGGVVNLLFQGVGGRLPQDIADPFRMAVWPLWSGAPAAPLVAGIAIHPEPLRRGVSRIHRGTPRTLAMDSVPSPRGLPGAGNHRDLPADTGPRATLERA